MLVINDVVVNIFIIWIIDHNWMYVFFFVGFWWIIILYVFIANATVAKFKVGFFYEIAELF